MINKFVKCDCGFIVSSDNEDKLVAELTKHAKEHHRMSLSREQVLAMAQPDPGQPSGSKRS